MYACLNCYKMSSHLNDCNKDNCQCNIIELDELIAPTIIMLNQKGYKTKYCCSGHYYNSSTTYINFDSNIERFSEIPSGFEYDQDVVNSKQVFKAGNTIRKHYNQNKYIEKYNEVIKSNKELLKWAINLPYLEK